jgi:hypothetical protein
MKGFIFFSVHEALFHPIAQILCERGVTAWSGFVWGLQQVKAITTPGITYDPLVVFSRDLLPLCNDGKAPDLEWLGRREKDIGMSIQRMLAAERHLLAGRNFDEIMRMAEVALREIAATYDRAKPDFVFSEDVSCFHSYVHFMLAKERGIPFWTIGSGRLTKRISVYASGMQKYERFEQRFAELRARGMAPEQRRAAEEYLDAFRDRPVRPTGMQTRGQRPGLGLAEAGRLKQAASRFLGDRDDPTAVSPVRAVRSRLTRLARIAVADARGMFEKPVAGEKYVLYPLHFQPESSTMVQGPLYVDQLALLRDIAVSLPADHRLYVKEHVSSRGRRPIEFYEQVRAIPAVRLLGPDEDTWTLIREASVVAVITGTVGWEGLMFGKPVVSFGEVFFNVHPSVYRGRETPKDRWYDMFQQATTSHVHDQEAVLAVIAALQQTTYPGFMANPSTFPETLEPQNIVDLAAALGDTLALPPAKRG